MELALFVLVVGGIAVGGILPVVSHVASLQPQTVREIDTFIPGLIPLPSERVVLAPSLVRVRR